MKYRGEARLALKIFVLMVGRNTCFIGGGGAPDTSGQNEAARQNAEISKDMWVQYKEVYLPKETQFATEAFNYDSPAKRAQQANLAQADVTSSFANQRDQSARSMASMGIAPGSGAWANQDAKMRMAEAAAVAGAQNAARLNVENMGFARKQDAISIGKGMPGTASASAAQAGATYGQAANTQMQNNNNNNANIGNAVRGGISAATLYNDWGMKDGGLVTKNERHMAAGGLVGNGNPGMKRGRIIEGEIVDGGNPRMKQVMDNNAASANVAAPAGADPASQLIQDAQLAKKGYDLYQKLNSAATLAPGAESGSAMIGNAAAGITSVPLAPAAAASGTAAGTAATGAATAGTAAAGGAAAGGTMAAIGTAMPWVGAGLLAAQALGLFKADGGEISADDPLLGQRKDIRDGGEIVGPGTETSDDVPLMGSDGEYMLNAESVKMIGKKKLDRLNAAGLARRYGVKGRAA
ncbi:MAG: hypothetical protein Q7T25_06160 [Sideroxyarcus sp.]|nr:hypothetical protein [Sideroxyarcus sp.]